MQKALQKWYARILQEKGNFLHDSYKQRYGRLVKNSPLGVRGKRHGKNGVRKFDQA
jgi:hypothetical protein